jgi:hypothetical protein
MPCGKECKNGRKLKTSIKREDGYRLKKKDLKCIITKEFAVIRCHMAALIPGYFLFAFL